MPIPGSILNNLLPLGVTPALAAYPSLATLRPITKGVDGTGQVTHTFADSTDPTLSNLPCRKSPLIQIRPQDQERNQNDRQDYDAQSQLNFAVFINVSVETLSEWQVKVDGVIYEIESVESDGSSITTRLMICKAVPYNA